MSTTVPALNVLNLEIRLRDVSLRGDLIIPQNPHGLVLFAHGSGSGRTSSRNRFVASFLQQQQIGTLLFDLLTEEEERLDARTAHLRFDIRLLAERLIHVTEWIHAEKPALSMGYFGASTGAAAALISAAHFGNSISTVVSRGGRPDLAGPTLPKVTAPTLLIVGGEDTGVIELNSEALARLECAKKLQIVPGATHLFPEPGALEAVAQLAANWFHAHFRPRTG